MNLVSQILPLSNVMLDVDVSSKKRIFEQAGLLFENNHQISRALVFDKLFEREKLGSTGLGKGVAIPHGKIVGLKKAVAAMFRLRTPIAFESPDRVGVKLVFVLLLPERAAVLHLSIMAQLAQMLRDESLREALYNAPSAEELHVLLSQWSSHVAD